MKRFFGKRAVLATLLVVTFPLAASFVTTRATEFECSTDNFKCTSQASCTGDLYTRSNCSLQCYRNVPNQTQPGQIEPTSNASCGTLVSGGGGGTGPVGGGGGGGWEGGWGGGGGLWDPCDPFWYADYDPVACAAGGAW